MTKATFQQLVVQFGRVSRMEDAGEGLSDSIAAQVLVEDCNVSKIPAVTTFLDNGVTYPVTFTVLWQKLCRSPERAIEEEQPNKRWERKETYADVARRVGRGLESIGKGKGIQTSWKHGQKTWAADSDRTKLSPQQSRFIPADNKDPDEEGQENRRPTARNDKERDRRQNTEGEQSQPARQEPENGGARTSQIDRVEREIIRMQGETDMANQNGLVDSTVERWDSNSREKEENGILSLETDKL